MFGLTPYRKNQGMRKVENGWLDMDSLFENFFNDSVFPAFYSNSGQMKVDIKEKEKEYVVEAELPGINKEDIKLELVDNNLTIAVERNEQVNEERENYIRKERRQCSMARSFYVENVDNEKVDAKFENGVLSVILPKKEQIEPNGRKIDIN
jgi:HSP20 family protein